MKRNSIPFGEWLPDLPPIGLKGATVASNVIPDAGSYRTFPSLNVWSNSIGSKCRGGVFARDQAHNSYNYVGDASALYSLATQTFGNTTRTAGAGGAYTLGADDYWEFANWNNSVFAVNGFTDLPQQISLGAANFQNMSIGVKAKHCTVMRDFFVLGNVRDSAANAYRVRWSSINNPFSFTVDAATLADYQDLPSEGGDIQKVMGGENCFIMQERAIWRMQFVGSPLIFQFDQVHKEIGAYIPQACARYQNLLFFLSQDGFYSFDGVNLRPIGRGKVDKFFFGDLDLNNLNRCNVAIDPLNKLVLWAYPSHSTMQGNPDKLLAYSWAFDRWVLIEGLNIEYLLQTITSGITLEGLDALYASLEAIPNSLDSQQWVGGQVILSAFNAQHRLCYFNGSAMAATVDTGEFQLYEGLRAQISEVRPAVDGLSANVTVSVLNRNNLTESVSTGVASVPLNATGFAPVLLNARYFRVRLHTAPSTSFTHLIGVEVTSEPAGVR